MEFASIGSGSKGNALVARNGRTVVMIDCGLSLKATKIGLDELGLSLEELTAVFVTHEHGDHIKGLSSLTKRSNAAIYMTAGTAYASGWYGNDRIRYVRDGDKVDCGDLAVSAVLVPHDAREPCQYVITSETRKLGVLTDLGSVSNHVVNAYRECDALVLEANHDLNMLRDGSYPASLKARVMGDWGHLSNTQARDLFVKINNDNLQWLVLAHISQQNNCVNLVKSAIGEVFPFHEKTLIAEQDSGFDWLAIS